MSWLKADFHTHTGDCVYDGIPHSTMQLINRAAKLNYQVLALTNHSYVIFSECWREYAAERGILLLPGIEASIQHRHVLIINADSGANRLKTFADLCAYRRQNNVLVIAPHPFYPGRICLRKELREHLDLFDALEYNSFYTRTVNPNTLAQKFAQQHGIPLVGGSDAHRLTMLGRTFSIIQAQPEMNSIFQAVRQGQVSVQTKPISAQEAVKLAYTLRLGSMKMDVKRLLFPSRLRCEYRPFAIDASLILPETGS